MIKVHSILTMLITCDIPIFAGFAALQRDTKYRQEYNIQITETSRKGDGIARIQGFDICKKRTSRTRCKGKGYISRREIRYSRNCSISST